MTDDPQANAIEVADDAIVASVAADISASFHPVEEDELDRMLRVLDRQQLDARIREREERAAAAREQEQLRLAAEQHAEQARKAVSARALAQREAREKLERQQREQAAAQDRDRLARLEAELAAMRPPKLTAAQQKQKTLIEGYQEISDLLHSWANPKRDPLAEIDALHAGLAAREAELEERQATEREAHRSAKYKADQAAAVARRESGKW